MKIEDQIKSEIEKIRDTALFPRFLLWVLQDPEFGVINYSNSQTRPSIQAVIRLYQEWVSGNKPSNVRFTEAANAVANAAYAASYVVNEAAYAAWAVANTASYAAAYAAAFSKLETQQVHLRKLIELQK